MNLRNKLTKILSLALVGALSFSPVVYAADNTTDVEITVEATEINITVPVDFSCVINPNIEEGFTYPDNLIVENNGYSPVMLSVAQFVDTTATFENDILPDGLPTGKEWNTLGVKDSLKYFSLGLYANDTSEWLLCKCEDTVYVKTVIDTTEADEVGVVPGESSVKFDLESSYGRSFKEVKNPIYKITWLAELYEEEEVTDVLLIDEEDSSVLNYDLTNTSNTASVVDFLDDLFGTKTVYADSNVSEINKSEFDESKVIGTAVITGLKDNTATEVVVCDYYKTSTGDYYKITGIKEGTSDESIISGNVSDELIIDLSKTDITEIPAFFAFDNTTLKKVILPSTIEHIGEYAFSGCTSLSSINFEGTNLQTIGDYAFGTAGYHNNYGQDRNTIIEEIYIPSTLISIGEGAFGGTPLNTVTFEEGSQLTSIGDYAFSYCLNLTSFDIPNSVTTIGREAFADTKLTSVVIPEGVTELEETFKGCRSLTTVTLPSTMGYMYQAFFNTAVSNVIFIEGIKEITGDLIFGSDSGSSKLTSIVIPDGVELIGEMTFGSTKLSTITLPASITEIGNNAFAYTSLATVNFKGTQEQWEAITIGSGNTKLTSATINYNYGEEVEEPEEETNLNAGLFDANDNLVASWDELINTYNLDVTKNYEIYNFQTESTSLYYVMNNNDALSNATKLVIDDSVTTIGKCAFFSCTALTNVTIPSSVISIGNNAFGYCSNLETVTFEENSQLKTIGDYAFTECSALPNISIPSTVTIIGDYAFYNCPNLETVIFAENSQLNIIRESAFSECSALTNISIPSTVTDIGKNAFYGCTHLETVVFAENSELTTISEGAFSGCSTLTNIVIPNKVSTISKTAFYNCTKLAEITIPKSVTNIGYNTFNACSNIETVNYIGTEDEWEAITIDTGNNLLTSATINYNYSE